MIFNNSLQFLILNKTILTSINQTSLRCLATHWDPKFKKLRGEKVKKVIKKII
jgi:hypothetical protein